MLDELTTTPAVSDIGRLAQILKAAGLTAAEVVAPPAGPEPGSDADLVDQAEDLIGIDVLLDAIDPDPATD